MKKWYLIDDCTTKRAGMFTEDLDTEDRDTAIEKALSEWTLLNAADHRARDAFYIAFGEWNEDLEDVDFDTITKSVDIISEWKKREEEEA